MAYKMKPHIQQAIDEALERDRNRAHLFAVPKPIKNDYTRCGVYFAQTNCDTYIKIGYSYRPGHRLAGLQRECFILYGPESLPVRFRLILHRPAEFEYEMHAKFAEHRHRLEWFLAHRNINAYISEHIGEHRPPEYFIDHLISPAKR